MILPYLLALIIGAFASVRFEGGSNSGTSNVDVPTTYATVGGTAEIKLPKVANYRRIIVSADPTISGPHIFRVCNGKNKKTCGFWENVSTKKKMSSGATTYNKNKKALTIKKIKKSDFGFYSTGNSNTFQYVAESIATGR